MNSMETVARCASDGERYAGDTAENQMPQGSSQGCPWDNWHPITHFDSFMADVLATPH